MVSAITMNHPQEPIGIAFAAMGAGLLSVISFTVESDGRLPSGESLREEIEIVDDETYGSPVYSMANCVHFSHFDSVLAEGDDWIRCIAGVRANTSAKSHAKLHAATKLEPGNTSDVTRRYRVTRDRFGHIKTLGCCCGA